MCMLQVLRPLLPSQAEGEVRPAALASFEAAQQLMEVDPAFDRIQGPDRCALYVTHCSVSQCSGEQSSGSNKLCHTMDCVAPGCMLRLLLLSA